ncbi:MAG: hypothetical protein EXS32_06025 [Opitutus sp.]|nr:hypothetical protein [Opitutus sp.]
MNPPASSRRWAGRAAGLAAVLGFLTLIGRFWHPVYGFTALIQLDAPNDNLKIAAFREWPVYVHRDTGGYDGLYYAQIAYHPALNAAELAPAMDNFAYRARRILPPALAWLLAGGQPAWIVHVYSVLNIAAWLALAGLLWRLLAIEEARGWPELCRGWLAWMGVLFSAGALASVRLALTDLVALVILAAGLFAVERGRWRTTTAVLAAAGLARETSLLAVAGAWERPWFSWRNFRRTLAVAAPLAAWLAYVRWRVGPADAGLANFTLPVAGLIEKWRAVLDALSTVNDQSIAWTTLLATLALTVQAAFFLTRLRPDDRWWRIGASYTAMMLCLGTAVWEGFPGAAARVLLPLTLAFNLLAHRTHARLVWLLAGNLSVFAGFVALRDVPVNSGEIATLRSGSLACIARVGEGWAGAEHHGRHVWSWASQRGTLTLEAWPKNSAQLRVDFALRSLTPRTVVIRQDGREIWRGDIGVNLSAHTVPLEVTAGRATLEFSTDTPGVPEGPGADARVLAFALYNPRLTVAQP